jgi:hypothetical protein
MEYRFFCVILGKNQAKSDATPFIFVTFCKTNPKNNNNKKQQKQQQQQNNN